jgi:hypothetical protein
MQMTHEIFGVAVGTDKNILGENREKGWKAVPEGCPEHVRQHIVEVRTARLEGREPRAYVPGSLPSAWTLDAIKRLAEL